MQLIANHVKKKKTKFCKSLEFIKTQKNNGGKLFQNERTLIQKCLGRLNQEKFLSSLVLYAAA